MAHLAPLQDALERVLSRFVLWVLRENNNNKPNQTKANQPSTNKDYNNDMIATYKLQVCPRNNKPWYMSYSKQLKFVTRSYIQLYHTKATRLSLTRSW